ncbi:hypothetical protein [Nonomuraea sp. NPDC049758]|uniref:hypothetical protein n=1 Tax=Nonomuraea sp. NPDC049758 TaxID=3154360 RepID=UPI003444BCAC
MAKVTYQGETHEIDLARLPLHEGIAIQKATSFGAVGMGQALKEGDFIAMAAIAWLILHFRMGKDITFDDICTGAHPVNMGDFTFEQEEQEETPDPPAAAVAGTRTSRASG